MWGDPFDLMRIISSMNNLLDDVDIKNDELRKAGLLVSSIIDQMPDALVLANSDGIVCFVNKRAVTLFGYGKEDFVGKPVELLIPTHLRARHMDEREEYIKDPHVRPIASGRLIQIKKADGTISNCYIALSPIKVEKLTYIAVVLRPGLLPAAGEDNQGDR